jgi:hypothetical protein
MKAPTITDLGQLETTYQQTEQLLQEAAETERVAFVRWQEAYGAYEVACDDRPQPGRLGLRQPPRSCGARPVGPGNQHRPGALLPSIGSGQEEL